MLHIPFKTVRQFSVMLVVFFAAGFFCFPQEARQDKQIRVMLWAEIDAYPGLTPSEDQNVSLDEFDPDNPFAFAISRMKQIAPFMLGGMINGWNYDYTPYDKTRKIDEYFSYSDIRPFDQKINPIRYHQPLVKDNRLTCWIYCDRIASQQMYYSQWSQVRVPKVRGIGYGSIEKGFDGIQEAVENAIKNAVREYWRSAVKNKPRRITGKVLLIHNPTVYIQDGRYVADLDFFMETDRIIPYSYF